MNRKELQKYGYPQVCNVCHFENFTTLSRCDYLPAQRRTYLHRCNNCGNEWHEEVPRYAWDREQEEYVKNDKYKLR